MQFKDKVPVRLGWRRTADGDPVRVQRPQADGLGRPGDYIGWRVLRDTDGTFVGFDLTNEEEAVYDTPVVRQCIRDGHLVVTDPNHPLASLMPPTPDAEPAPALVVKASKGTKPRVAAQED